MLVRQRPGSAKGVIFVTLEDETGVANLVLMPPVFERFRKELLGSRLLGADGRVERQGAVIHLKVDRLYDLSDRLSQLTAPPLAQAATSLAAPPPVVTAGPAGDALQRHMARARRSPPADPRPPGSEPPARTQLPMR